MQQILVYRLLVEKSTCPVYGFLIYSLSVHNFHSFALLDSEYCSVYFSQYVIVEYVIHANSSSIADV